MSRPLADNAGTTMVCCTPAFLYFDLGNVLLTFDNELAIRQMADVAGVSPETVRRVVFQSGLQDACERGEISSRGFHRRFCRRTSSQPDYHALLRASSDMFAENPEAVQIVRGLREQGCRVGLLSNTCDAHWDFCSNTRFPFLRDLFEVTALSFRLGVMKPAPRIYERAVELAGVRPDEVFFVDDRVDNVAAAQQAGFDAVPFTTVQQLRTDLAARGLRLAA